MHGMEAVAAKDKKPRGPDAEVSLNVSLGELYRGATKTVRVKRRVVCKGCKRGWPAADSARCRRCAQCPNEIANVKVQMGPFVLQQQQEVQSDERCRDDDFELTAEVEAGMRDGDELVFERMSEQSPGSIPGNLRMKLRSSTRGADEVFRREGDDLHTEMAISLKAALLGFSRSLQHLDDHEVYIDRRGMVTQPMQTIHIAGEGMPVRNTSPSRNGTLHVRFVVQLPAEPSEQALALARALPDD
uniref:Chaperone DnaJ C-terminal domain-containing protein n=2 Tax=Calcidiscus leptoporus TaxID=127549 RepID=A0A7S0NWQ5_9EUKA|mmetsp:Transcript_32932/g.76931  ORF Transcript_32932/g.76931 Transcript_32932/m.76931 type:complete len:244 (+) Transcript_32932:868-1599(+)